MDKFRVKTLAASMESEDSSNDSELIPMDDYPEYHNTASLEDADVLKAIAGVVLIAAVATALFYATRKTAEWVASKMLGKSSGGGGSNSGVSRSALKIVEFEVKIEQSKKKQEEYLAAFARQNEERHQATMTARAEERERANKIAEKERQFLESEGKVLTPHFIRLGTDISRPVQKAAKVAELCQLFLTKVCGDFITALQNNSTNAGDYEIPQSVTTKLFDEVFGMCPDIFGNFASANRGVSTIRDLPQHFRNLTAGYLMTDTSFVGSRSRVMTEFNKCLKAIEEIAKSAATVQSVAKDYHNNLVHYENSFKALISDKQKDEQIPHETRAAISKNKAIIESVIHLGAAALNIPNALADSADATSMRYHQLVRKLDHISKGQ
jgi:hypothetical protein